MAANADKALIAALLKRLNHQRIPRLQVMEEKVDRGEQLTEADIKYLDNVIEDSEKVVPLFSRYPEYQKPAKQLYELYEKITRQALENEKNKSGKPED